MLQVFDVQTCVINTQLVTYFLQYLCTVTLAARCQTPAGFQQCPPPPPRTDRQCGQIPSTITCTSEAPIKQPDGDSIGKQLDYTKGIIKHNVISIQILSANQGIKTY